MSTGILKNGSSVQAEAKKKSEKKETETEKKSESPRMTQKSGNSALEIKKKNGNCSYLPISTEEEEAPNLKKRHSIVSGKSDFCKFLPCLRCRNKLSTDTLK